MLVQQLGNTIRQNRRKINGGQSSGDLGSARKIRQKRTERSLQSGPTRIIDTNEFSQWTSKPNGGLPYQWSKGAVTHKKRNAVAGVN